jgi:hypothetical protein
VTRMPISLIFLTSHVGRSESGKIMHPGANEGKRLSTGAARCLRQDRRLEKRLDGRRKSQS